MFMLIVYDIRDNARRRKIDKSLSAYGVRVNLSAFELSIKNKRHLVLLKKELMLHIDKKVDSIRLYHFNNQTVAYNEELGSGSVPFIEESSYVS